MAAALPVSPLAPARFPAMPPVPGVRLATAAAGIRYAGRDDVLLVELIPGTTVAGVLTRSQTAAAPILWCRENLRTGSARALLVNSGNANAFTGARGVRAIERSVAGVTSRLGCREREVFVASTGVIGVPLPDERIAAVLDDLTAGLRDDGWLAAARAIMTTDTYPKGGTRTATLTGRTVTINGFAKGSGMIAPDMATMLAFVFTDAAIDAAALQVLVEDGAVRSFNRITVDGDTSTSDTLLVFATGAAGGAPIADAGDPGLADVRAKLHDLMLDLAFQVVKDGEGASKFVTVTVEGAETNRAAEQIAFSIANSPLVKTAIAGEDANWGRIVMAVGKAGERADREKLGIRIGGITLAEQGAAVEGYDETPVAAHMRGSEITIEVDVGLGGPGRATVWTCDLGHGYIDINGSYRT